ncbi:BTAD domain-containing putative transcriptional regulator [Streptomyces sp. NPDC047072]|uniref:AfsR/SARP family transcriptional regulator n=1 Tax=Streptomyces sp. NPDC047072 TaxID=3154809 RepID=UPI00340C2B48
MGQISLPAGRERVVVSQLILNANKVVSVERLADAVWDYHTPSTARTQIQICISRLRRAFDAAGLSGRIVTSCPGYQLVADQREVDLFVFEREISAALRVIRQRSGPAETAEGIAVARRALGLFTGEPLADVGSEVVQSVARQLAQRRLHVLEVCLDAQLDLGQAADVIDELAALVAEHPLHGRLRALNMKALQRLGRRADALAVYREALREYRDRLGLEPDPELRELNEAILHDMSHRSGGTRDHEGRRGLDQVSPTPYGALRRPALGRELLPVPGSVHLDGRSEELRALGEALRLSNATDPAAPRGPVLGFVSGPPGVGKTAFAVATAARLAPDYPDGQLYHDMRGADRAPVDPHTVLTTFLRALGVPSAELAPTPEERLTQYRELLRGRRVLVVLDNARDFRQIFPFLTDGSGCAVILVTRRPWAPRPVPYRIRLGPLGTDASVSLLTRLIGASRVSAEPEEARRLVERCAGLPLALTALASRLNRRPQCSLARYAAVLEEDSVLLDQLSCDGFDVRGALLADYQELRPAAQLLLQRLTLWGEQSFSSAVADTLLGCSPGVSAEVLDDLVEMGFVEIRPDGGATKSYRLVGLMRLLARERLLAQRDPADGAPHPERLREGSTRTARPGRVPTPPGPQDRQGRGTQPTGPIR